MMVNKSSYNLSIGYLKAIGIILMILGHSGNDLHVNNFIYMFHMPLFFIASGYCFSQRNLDNPRLFVYKKIKGIWWPYVKWSLVFLVLHNIFFQLNLYNGQYGYLNSVSHRYTYDEILNIAIDIILRLQGAEQLLGGYWFLSALFWGSLIGWVVLRFVKNELYGGALLFIVCTVLNKTCWQIPIVALNSQAFTAALFMVIGYGMAKNKLETFLSWKILFSFFVTCLGSCYWYMELNHLSYSNKCFAPYVFTATIATWSIYSLCKRVENHFFLTKTLLSFVGKNTLTVLTWHFLAFKLVSLIIIFIYGLPIERLAEFPVISEYALQGWWLAYFSVALMVTLLIAYCNKWIEISWLKL